MNTLFTCNDINKTFSDVVKSYLEQGFVVDPYRMSSCYSNTDAYIDLVSPLEKDKLLRVWLQKTQPLKGNHRYTYVKTVSVKAYDRNTLGSIWYDKGEDVKTINFYPIVENKIYTTSLEKFEEKQKISETRVLNRIMRMSNTMTEIKVNDKVKKSILNKIHSIRGMKKATIDCIQEVKKYKPSDRPLYYSIAYINNKGLSCELILR